MELSLCCKSYFNFTGQETDKEVEGALDDVAKQLDKQALEEKEKDDDDEGKCNIFSLDISSFSFFLDFYLNLSQMPFLCLHGRGEMQLYILFTVSATV